MYLGSINIISMVKNSSLPCSWVRTYHHHHCKGLSSSCTWVRTDHHHVHGSRLIIIIIFVNELSSSCSEAKSIIIISQDPLSSCSWVKTFHHQFLRTSHHYVHETRPIIIIIIIMFRRAKPIIIIFKGRTTSSSEIRTHRHHI